MKSYKLHSEYYIERDAPDLLIKFYEANDGSVLVKEYVLTDGVFEESKAPVITTARLNSVEDIKNEVFIQLNNALGK